MGDSCILSREQILEMRKIFKDVSVEYLEKNLSTLSSAGRLKHKKALDDFYSRLFVEYNNYSRKRKRPDCERVFEPLSKELLDLVFELEIKVKKLVANNSVMRQNNKKYLQMINVARGRKEKSSQEEESILSLCNSIDKGQYTFQAESQVAEWLQEATASFESCLEHIGELKSQVAKTTAKIKELSKVCETQFSVEEGKNVDADGMKLPMAERRPQDWGFAL
ncbi:uncharacterized protein LOC126318696 [Schistocerca gregaria]|uniref:uncharacterized protein LOC126318696 n=1 Tax=Schistocerca gregaria TaxID=7010 RepID=UPI00211EACCF|nr:uncharacterized protein LOC126318696 [Schistocerca gregaria]